MHPPQLPKPLDEISSLGRGGDSGAVAGWQLGGGLPPEDLAPVFLLIRDSHGTSGPWRRNGRLRSEKDHVLPFVSQGGTRWAPFVWVCLCCDGFGDEAAGLPPIPVPVSQKVLRGPTLSGLWRLGTGGVEAPRAVLHLRTLSSSGSWPHLQKWRLRLRVCFLACHFSVCDLSKSLGFSRPRSPL